MQGEERAEQMESHLSTEKENQEMQSSWFHLQFGMTNKQLLFSRDWQSAVKKTTIIFTDADSFQSFKNLSFLLSGGAVCD